MPYKYTKVNVTGRDKTHKRGDDNLYIKTFVRVEMERTMQELSIFITGASSGIGKAAARKLKKRGHRVYAAARHTEHMRDLEQMGICTHYLDISSEASIQECIEWLFKNENHIDVLINNAGYGSFGPIEDTPIEEGRKQFEVNLFGLARITQLLLPCMRANHFGKIINVSSMGGRMYTPFGGWYHATKYALEGFSDCLRMETSEFGIDVILIEPGTIRTNWENIASRHLRETASGGAYKNAADRTALALDRRYQSDLLTSPEKIASIIDRAIRARHPRTRYLKGRSAKISVFMKWLLPDRTFDRLYRHILS